YYLVKWVGWPMEANTWEPADNLSCPNLIHDFHEDYTKQLNKFLKERKLSWKTTRTLFRNLDKYIKFTGKNELVTPEAMVSEIQPWLKYNWFKDLLTLKVNLALFPFFYSCSCNRKKRKVFSKNFLNRHRQILIYAEEKRKVLHQLQMWQKRINEISKSMPLIAVENEVDLCSFPPEFEYVESNITGKDVIIPTDPLIGCDCTNGCTSRLISNGCCPGIHKGRAPYANKLVKIKPGKAIFECNRRCKCGVDCPNRVVQHGPRNALSIYRTSNGKGWGVKTLQFIPKGTFVMEYVGEVITNDEAERRGKQYDNNGITYLFDLDYYDSENPLTVDATRYGNISHFVNHSCSPNLQVYNVFINNLDPSLPRIALFAKCNIGTNEELTFDYQMTGDNTTVYDKTIRNRYLAYATDTTNPSSIKRTRCLCASPNCREWLV
uniref:Histone-lysine N-methyltransferase n=1 Tax=Ciona intestinalis TaxID=7719 RepID=F6YDS2_CIOIN